MSLNHFMQCWFASPINKKFPLVDYLKIGTVVVINNRYIQLLLMVGVFVILGFVFM